MGVVPQVQIHIDADRAGSNDIALPRGRLVGRPVPASSSRAELAASSSIHGPSSASARTIGMLVMKEPRSQMLDHRTGIVNAL